MYQHFPQVQFSRWKLMNRLINSIYELFIITAAATETSIHILQNK